MGVNEQIASKRESHSYCAIREQDLDTLKTALAKYGAAVVPNALPADRVSEILRLHVQPILHAHGIDTDASRSWGSISKLAAIFDQRHAYQNIEGAQLEGEPFHAFDVLACAPRLECALCCAESWVARGQFLERLHVRYPLGRFLPPQVPVPPGIGWHIERGAGYNLHRVAILHLTNVQRGGGGVVVVCGSHNIIRRFFWPLLWPHVPYLTGVIIAHAIALFARLFMPWCLMEVCASAGDAVLLDPFVVHSPSTNTKKNFRFTFQLRAETTTILELEE
jgi:hypothetical protein